MLLTLTMSCINYIYYKTIKIYFIYIYKLYKNILRLSNVRIDKIFCLNDNIEL